MTTVFEIDANHAVKKRAIFAKLATCTPLNAVLEGHSSGRIFVDNTDQPSVGFVWTPWGYYYLAGAAENVAFNHALGQTLVDALIPASVTMGECWPALYPDSEMWASQFDVLLPGRSLKLVPRRTFDFHLERFSTNSEQRDCVPDGFRFATFAELLSTKLGGELTGEICATWRDVPTFAEHGFGFALLNGDDIASLCYACFVGDGEAEVSVRTEEAYRRRGLATLVTAAFIEACLERGLTPSWECWYDNTASNALARKLGFEKRADVPVYVWEEAVA